MFKKIGKTISVLKRLSFETHVWCLCVVGGSVLLAYSFFVGPMGRQMSVRNEAAAPSSEIVIIEYSSVLGSISQMESLDSASADEITSIIPEETISLDDVPVEIADEDAEVAEEIKADEIAQAVAATVEKLSASNPGKEITINTQKEYDIKEVELLERLVECEAKSEDYEGKLLVANVVLNRLATGYWGDTITSVIEAPGQFDPVSSGAVMTVQVSKTTVDAVINALNGDDLSEGAIYFRKSPEKMWGGKEYLFRHGAHSFYK